MLNIPFGAESAGSGIGAFGVNIKSLLFQFITFVLVVMILRRFVFPKLIATLEKRREALEESLAAAKKAQESLVGAEAKVEELIKSAREDADEAIADAGRKAQEVIASAEKVGAEKAARIITEAEQHLGIEREKLRSELRNELAALVTKATEKVLHTKIDSNADTALISSAVKEIK